MPRIAIFASGDGSNAENIVTYFRQRATAEVVLILANKPEAGVFRRAERLGVPAFHVTPAGFREGEALRYVQDYEVDFIVLAGFLLRVTGDLLAQYAGRIVNIHPALLPKYGGRGMYGHHVHQAVIDAGEHESGITIHFIDDRLDEGQTIFQASCPVLPGDTPEALAARIHALEYAHFPRVIEEVLTR